MNLNLLHKELLKIKSDVRAEHAQRFFKTGPGEYAEGDIFLGITVPEQRVIAKKFNTLTLNELTQCLKSPFHEERFIALCILISQYNQGNTKTKSNIYKLYIKNAERVNNWDLVDNSAHHIVGHYLYEYEKNDNKLVQFAHSKNLWKKRIAMVSTFYFIKQQNDITPVKIAEILLYDSNDLIHKAVGWMLREMGKRVGLKSLYLFLDQYYNTMPRTTLRYAIEKLDIQTKAIYMKK